jgi:bacteriorhodopsin
MELASYARSKKRFDQHFAKDHGSRKASAGEARGRSLLRAKVYVSAVEMVSWVGFPLVWYLRKFGKVDFYTEELLYVWLDILSKGGAVRLSTSVCVSTSVSNCLQS